MVRNDMTDAPLRQDDKPMSDYRTYSRSLAVALAVSCYGCTPCHTGLELVESTYSEETRLKSINDSDASCSREGRSMVFLYLLP